MSIGALLLVVLPVFAQEAEPVLHGHEHGSGNSVAILFDMLILVAVILGMVFGWMGTKMFGGAIGGGLKLVFIGLGVFTLDRILSSLHHYDFHIVETLLGEAGHDIFHHVLVLFAFSVMAVGFFRFWKATLPTTESK